MASSTRSLSVHRHARRSRPLEPRQVGLPTDGPKTGGGSYFRPIMFKAEMVRQIIEGNKTQTRRLIRVDDAPITKAWVEWDARTGWKAHPLDPRHYQKGIPSNAQNVRMCGDYLKCDSVLGSHTVSNRVLCPYGVREDRLWVRETWAAPHKFDGHAPSEIPKGTRIHHAATAGLGGPLGLGGLMARPSIFMMRWMSRLELEVRRVRAERVDMISEGDAAKEGVSLDVGCPCEGDDEVPGPHKKLCRFNREDWPGETPLGVSNPNRMAFAVLWDSINGKRSPFNDGAYVWAIDFRIAGVGPGTHVDLR